MGFFALFCFKSCIFSAEDFLTFGNTIQYNNLWVQTRFPENKNNKMDEWMND